MEAKAILRNVRIAPRKVKVVCDLIRGKNAAEANAILLNTPKAASEHLSKLLKSAMANAENNHNMDPEKLYVDQGLRMPGPDHEAHPSDVSWPRIPHPEENISHHAGTQREGIRRR